MKITPTALKNHQEKAFQKGYKQRWRTRLQKLPSWEHIPSKGTFEDEFPFSQVGCVSSLDIGLPVGFESWHEK